MSLTSRRLRRRIERDFPAKGSATEVCRLVSQASGSERVQAAIVLAARGDFSEIQRGVDLAQIDWRDVLVNGGLANEDWPQLLDSELGSLETH